MTAPQAGEKSESNDGIRDWIRPHIDRACRVCSHSIPSMLTEHAVGYSTRVLYRSDTVLEETRTVLEEIQYSKRRNLEVKSRNKSRIVGTIIKQAKQRRDRAKRIKIQNRHNNSINSNINLDLGFSEIKDNNCPQSINRCVNPLNRWVDQNRWVDRILLLKRRFIEVH